MATFNSFSGEQEDEEEDEDDDEDDCADHGVQCICRAATGWIDGKRFEPRCMGEVSDLPCNFRREGG